MEYLSVADLYEKESCFVQRINRFNKKKHRGLMILILPQVSWLDRNSFIPLITQISSIPEDIAHDSTEEKLYTKVSDIILAKCFLELNMEAIVLHERANSADVLVRSKYHNYSLIADAKAFRLSRTAKNQKYFKVESMKYFKVESMIITNVHSCLDQSSASFFLLTYFLYHVFK